MTALRRTKRIVHECRCERCGHEWTALKEPTSCASCKSRSWNVPPGSVPLGRKPMTEAKLGGRKPSRTRKAGGEKA